MALKTKFSCQRFAILQLIGGGGWAAHNNQPQLLLLKWFYRI